MAVRPSIPRGAIAILLGLVLGAALLGGVNESAGNAQASSRCNAVKVLRVSAEELRSSCR